MSDEKGVVVVGLFLKKKTRGWERDDADIYTTYINKSLKGRIINLL